MATLPVCLIGVESCGGSSYWARVFTRCGHEVRLMNPKFVKP
jgi:transposase